MWLSHAPPRYCCVRFWTLSSLVIATTPFIGELLHAASNGGKSFLLVAPDGTTLSGGPYRDQSLLFAPTSYPISARHGVAKLQPITVDSVDLRGRDFAAPYGGTAQTLRYSSRNLVNEENSGRSAG